jgi:hypothetical protein
MNDPCIVAFGLAAMLLTLGGAPFAYVEAGDVIDNYNALRDQNIRNVGVGKVRTVAAEFERERTPLTIATNDSETARLTMPNEQAPPLELGVKIWVEQIADGPNPGKRIDLTTYEFSRRERFRLRIDAAVPVQLMIQEIFPIDNTPPRVIVPDIRYPQTFQTMMPGKPAFPIAFRMGDHDNSEGLSILIMSVEQSPLPINDPSKLPQRVLRKAIVNETIEKMIELDAKVARGQVVESEIRAPAPSRPDDPNAAIDRSKPSLGDEVDRDDSAIYYTGPGKVGRFTIIFKKKKPM